jgi:hypothetical protein
VVFFVSSPLLPTLVPEHETWNIDSTNSNKTNNLYRNIRLKMLCNKVDHRIFRISC